MENHPHIYEKSHVIVFLFPLSDMEGRKETSGMVKVASILKDVIPLQIDVQRDKMSKGQYVQMFKGQCVLLILLILCSLCVVFVDL